MKILTVIGARPQFIKAAVVSRAFKRYSSQVNEVIVHTGQHYDANMSEIFFDELNISRPDYNLAVGGGTHGQNSGRMIEKIEAVLFEEKPDWVLVYGDTDSTLAGTLAAVKLNIPVVHVEAGLRSFNRKMPEEINRVLTDHASDLLFTPTNTATNNLSIEGISGKKVQQVGDVMYEAALYYAERAEHSSTILETNRLEHKAYILATIHRAENTDDKIRMSNILAAFAEVKIPVIWPLHPRAHKQIEAFDLQFPSSVQVIEPVGYLDMVMLEMHAQLIATDSGGVQKEAYFHKVPCITLRDETEWVELVDHGYNQLVGANRSKITNALNHFEKMNQNFERQLYGNGQSSQKIIDTLISN